MVAYLARPLGVVLSGPFWISAVFAGITPSTTGYQDLGAFFARQPGVSARWHQHLIASPFGTIHAATFSFARPIGTALPEPTVSQPVNFDPHALDVKTWSVDAWPLNKPELAIEYPSVDRSRKGDRLPLPQPVPSASGTDAPPQARPAGAPAVPALSPRPKSTDAGDDAHPGNSLASVSIEDDAVLADKPPELPPAGEARPGPDTALHFVDDNPAERSAQVYFGVAAMGVSSVMEQWAPGAAPVLATPVDPDIKLSALQGAAPAGPGGVSVAGKDDASRLRTPAERLGLSGKTRAKAEKCIADAVYFEARGEQLRGQEAVAQVVMNRVFSGKYPNDVCGVVYQNAQRHLACQFTFACEGKDLNRIDEADMWEQAKQIARDTLDGKIWLPEVGHATHYHAYWVRPSWVHEMKKMYSLGVHTFYRPRAWGDGSDAPVWAAPAETAKPAGTADGAAKDNKPSDTARAPQASLSGDDGKGAIKSSAKL
jgi:spore germination cell wall hydrolase CwlJ-like protein